MDVGAADKAAIQMVKAQAYSRPGEKRAKGLSVNGGYL